MDVKSNFLNPFFWARTDEPKVEAIINCPKIASYTPEFNMLFN